MLKTGYKKLFISVCLAVVMAVGFMFCEASITQAQTLTTVKSDDSVTSATTRINTTAATTNTEPASGYTRLGNVMGWIIYYLVAALGWCLDVVVSIMLYVAGYNDIFSQSAVQVGWKIVRDICNNFFIIILMIIAVATILRIESYKYNKLLSKLLVMAVLINFSAMFTGLLIDFSQILTISFVTKIYEIPSKNVLLGAIGLPNGLQQDTTSLKNDLQKDASSAGIVAIIAALIVVLVVAIVSIVVVLIVTAILAFRIIAFWFLTILSPLAFFASTFPRGQEYWSRWWKELSKYLIVGPVMVFFLYISFTVMLNLQGTKTLSTENSLTSSTTLTETVGSSNVTPASNLSKLASTKGLFNVIIAIGLLIGTLVVAQESGAAGSSLATKGIKGLRAAGKGAVKKLGGAAATVTGTKFASDTAKKYLAGRASVKKAAYDDKVANAANSLGAGIGTAKGKVMSPLNNLWNKATGQKNLEKTQKELADHETKMGDEKIQALKEKRDFKDRAGNTYSYSQMSKKWTSRDAAGNMLRTGMDEDQLQRMITSGHLEELGVAGIAGFGNPARKVNTDSFEYTKKQNGKWERKEKGFNYMRNAQGNWDITDSSGNKVREATDSDLEVTEEQLTRELGGITEADVANKRKEKDQAEARKKWVQRGGVAAVAGAGAVIGGLTGGLGLAGLAAGGGLAGLGALNARKLGAKISDAGKDDIKAFGKYRSQQVSDARTKAKDMDSGEVLATMDDQSKDRFTRAALAMEAMSRGLLTLKQAEEKRDALEKQFKSTNDKGLLSQLRQIMEKKYLGGTQVFKDAKINPLDGAKYDTEQKRVEAQRKKEAAQRQIRQGFEDGSYKIKDLDSGTLESATPLAAAGLSVQSFLSQYKDKDVSDSKRQLIRQVLERDGSQPSRQKLAHMVGLAGVWKKMKPGTAGHSPAELAEAQQFMKTLGIEDIEGLIKKHPDGLQEAVRGAGGVFNLSPEVKMALTNDELSPINKSIRAALGLPQRGPIR